MSVSSQQKEQLGVGICGLGTVGSGAFNLLVNNEAEISRKTNRRINVVQVGCRRDHPNCDLTGVDVTRDIFDVVKNPAVDIVLELIGGTDVAMQLVVAAIENKKHVVTANKALIALHGEKLFKMAADAGVCLKYEAAIAGGIPIVKAIREGLAGNDIEFVAGIINGTTNFILTEMESAGNRDFADVLAEAQALGYAEADPTFDIEGVDAAHKATIMSAIAFGIPVQFDKAYVEGITKLTEQDIRYAEQLGYRIKLLGIVKRRPEGVELRVHPSLVPSKRLIANVEGAMNAVLVQADAVGSTMYYGKGAGAEPTASAVLGDVIDAAINLRKGTHAPLGTFTDAKLLPISEIHCEYMIGLEVADKPGVLHAVTGVFARNSVSIRAAEQDGIGSDARLVFLTHDAKEASVQSCLAEFKSLDVVKHVGALLRVVAG